MIINCPGANAFKQPEPQDIRCPFCNYDLEIWTDEIKVKCPNCQKIVSRKQAPSCLDWCKYAKECAGDTVYKNYLENKRLSLKNVA